MDQNKTKIIILAGILFFFTAGCSLFTSEKNDSSKGTVKTEDVKDVHDCPLAAGYSWCDTKQKCLLSGEEYCGDPAKDGLFQELSSYKKESGVAFGDIRDAKMEWRRADGSKASLECLSVGAEKIGEADYQKIVKFIAEKGYIEDNNNAADGVEGSIRGFLKGNRSCLISSVFLDISKSADSPAERLSDLRKTELSCADMAGDISGTKTEYELANGTVNEDKSDYFIKAAYPVIKGLKTESIARSFNDSSRKIVDDHMDIFRKDISEAKAEPGMKSGLEWNYEVKFRNDDLISILMSGEQYIAGTAHPSHPMIAFNFDLKKGKVMALDDVFRSESNYLDAISAYAQKMLKEKNDKEQFTDPDMIAGGAGPKEDNFSVWNVTGSGLSVSFPEYQVAAYAAGPQEITIPWNELREMIEAAGAARNLIQK